MLNQHYLTNYNAPHVKHVQAEKISNVDSRTLFKGYGFSSKECEEINTYLACLKDYDLHLYFHSIAVAKITKILISGLRSKLHYNISKKMERKYILSSLYHDIGKLFIDKDILTKPAKLTFEEYEKIKEHSLIGARYFLAQICNSEFIAKGILDHHERLDSTGYPRGLKKDLISFQGKIIALADSYDAIYSKRHYKENIKHEKVIDILKKDKKIYDKKLILLLSYPNILKEIKGIYKKNK